MFAKTKKITTEIALMSNFRIKIRSLKKIILFELKLIYTILLYSVVKIHTLIFALKSLVYLFVG